VAGARSRFIELEPGGGLVPVTLRDRHCTEYQKNRYAGHHFAGPKFVLQNELGDRPSKYLTDIGRSTEINSGTNACILYFFERRAEAAGTTA
jgi:hypothetical protein